MFSMQERIEKKLNDAFSPSYLKVENQSYLHKGHMGDDGTGESHFSLEISADLFDGLGRVECQRAIYQALGDEMKIIHALSICVCSKNK